MVDAISTNCRCVDYIFIDRGSFGTTEICGNQSLLELKLNVGKFKVIFRSSDRISGGAGFKMIVTCFQEMERDLPGSILSVNNLLKVSY